MPWIIDKIRDILPNRPYGKTAKDFRVARLIDINRVIESINTSFDEVETAILNIPAGPQGPIGPQGVAGPVGPAGLNWQGAWDTNASYVIDDAVGYAGASWFCINPVGPSALSPDADPTNWALLAAQGSQGPQGPQGIQGPIGPQGVAGPVGPAGLNWQGAWSASNSYVVDDAVGYNGASWFCIDPVGPSVATPDLDPTNWALLAAEGAQGPIGPQGPAGSIAPYTNATVFATNSSTGTVMTADINGIVANTNNWNVRLPQNVPAGKEVFVYGSSQIGTGWTNVQAFNLGSTIITNKSNQSTGQFQVYLTDIVRFTSAGNDFWIAENITSSPLRFNNQIVSSVGNFIYESALNSTTSALSAATLNATYSNFTYPLGFKAICPNISGGGLMYIKTGTATWVSVPVTAVV
jgi:chitodextrinase